jgi:hypothetical protein
MMKKLLTVIAVAVIMLAPMTASAARIFVGGPYFGPAYYGSYWGPVGYAYPGPAMGEVKIETKAKDAQVFINGAFAGTTKDAKTLHLRPGAYDIEVRFPGAPPVLSEHIFVSAGKTLHLHPAA